MDGLKRFNQGLMDAIVMNRLLAEFMENIGKEVRKERERRTLRCRAVILGFEPKYDDAEEDDSSRYAKRPVPGSAKEADTRKAAKVPEAPADAHSVPANDPTSVVTIPAFGLFRPYIDRDDDVWIQMGPHKFCMHKEDAKALYVKIGHELRKMKKAEEGKEIIPPVEKKAGEGRRRGKKKEE